MYTTFTLPPRTHTYTHRPHTQHIAVHGLYTTFTLPPMTHTYERAPVQYYVMLLSLLTLQHSWPQPDHTRAENVCLHLFISLTSVLQGEVSLLQGSWSCEVKDVIMCFDRYHSLSLLTFFLLYLHRTNHQSTFNRPNISQSWFAH